MGGQPAARGLLGAVDTRVLALLAGTLTAVLIGVVLLLALPAPGSAKQSLPSDGGPLAPGMQAPTFTAASVEPGQPAITSSSFRGSTVVLNFFASWCVPCKAETPLLAKTAEHSNGVRFVGVDVNDTDKSVRRFLAKAGVSYPVVADPADTITQRYRLAGLPTTFLIAPDGRIAAVHTGAVTAKLLAGWLKTR